MKIGTTSDLTFIDTDVVLGHTYAYTIEALDGTKPYAMSAAMTIAHDNSAIEGVNAAAAAIHAVSGGIELSGLAGTQVNVFDTLGRLAARVNVEAQTETVALPQGVYVVVTDGGLRVKVTVLKPAPPHRRPRAGAPPKTLIKVYHPGRLGRMIHLHCILPIAIPKFV